MTVTEVVLVGLLTWLVYCPMTARAELAWCAYGTVAWGAGEGKSPLTHAAIKASTTQLYSKGSSAFRSQTTCRSTHIA